MRARALSCVYADETQLTGSKGGARRVAGSVAKIVAKSGYRPDLRQGTLPNWLGHVVACAASR